MIRVITMIVLAAFSPMQLYAANFGGFGSDTQIEYFVPRGPEAPPQKFNDPRLTEKISEEASKNGDAENSGTNWWLWGGLTVLAVGVIAAVAGGGGGGGGGGGPSPAATGSGTVTW